MASTGNSHYTGTDSHIYSPERVTESQTEESPTLPYPNPSPGLVQSMVPLRTQEENLLSGDENSTEFSPASSTTTAVEALPSPPASPAFPRIVEGIMSFTNENVIYDRKVNNQTTFTCWDRAVLVTWLLKACEYFECRRETFHLAVDYLDRYIASESFDDQSDLAMVTAASCLIAMKVEGPKNEVPKRGNLRMPDFIEKIGMISSQAESLFLWEEQVLRALKFRLHPVTPNNWLGMFLQKAQIEMKSNEFFIDTTFSQLAFINIARLIDLCLMDNVCIKFNYKVLTLSALYHFTNAEYIADVTDLTVRDLAPCIKWMIPKTETIKGLEPCKIRAMPFVFEDELYTMQLCDLGYEDVAPLYLDPQVTPIDNDPQPDDLIPQLSSYLISALLEEKITEVIVVESSGEESGDEENSMETAGEESGDEENSMETAGEESGDEENSMETAGEESGDEENLFETPRQDSAEAYIVLKSEEDQVIVIDSEPEVIVIDDSNDDDF